MRAPEEIARDFAELLRSGLQYTDEANALIEEYAAAKGIPEHEADVDLHAKAEELLDQEEEA